MIKTANLKDKLRAVPLHFQVFLALLVILSTVLPLTLTGCGNGESGASPAANAGKTAALRLRFNSESYRKLNLRCKSYAFNFFNKGRRNVLAKTLQRSSFDGEGWAEIKDVPEEASELLGLITDKNAALLALIQPHTLQLKAGQTTELEIDDILTDVGELDKYLTDLRLTAKQSAVTLPQGKKLHVSVKGVFSFDGYEDIKCNLTQAGSLKWKSSDEGLVKPLGKGYFQALQAGEATISAVLGNKEKSLKVTVAARSEESGSDAETEPDEPFVLEPDPESVEEAEDPQPDNPVIDEAACLELNLNGLPEGCSYIFRAYDAENQSRLVKNDLTESNPVFKLDASVTKIGGLIKSESENIVGLFSEEIVLESGKTLTVTPEILTGEALAARGRLKVFSAEEAYDFDTAEVYRKGFVSVSCRAEFGYDVIPGAWQYEIVGNFFEDLASFDDDGEPEEGDSAVFRFFGPGTHTINVVYKGVAASFTVTIVGPNEPIEIVFFKPDSSLGAVSSFKSYELQGFANDGAETFTKQFTPSDLNSEGKLSLADQGLTSDTKSMSLFAVTNDKKISLSQYKQLLVPGKVNLVDKAYDIKTDNVLKQSIKSIRSLYPIIGYVGQTIDIHVYGIIEIDKILKRSVEITNLVAWQNDYADYIECIDAEHGKFLIKNEYRSSDPNNFYTRIFASYANFEDEIDIATYSSTNADFYKIGVDISSVEHPRDFAVVLAVEDLNTHKLLAESDEHIRFGGSYFTSEKFQYTIPIRNNTESTLCRIYAFIFDTENRYLSRVIVNDAQFEEGKNYLLDCSASKTHTADGYMYISQNYGNGDMSIRDVNGVLGGGDAIIFGFYSDFNLHYYIPLSNGSIYTLYLPQELMFGRTGSLPISFAYGHNLAETYPERIHTEFSNPSIVESYEFDDGDRYYYFINPGESTARYIYTQPNVVKLSKI